MLSKPLRMRMNQEELLLFAKRVEGSWSAAGSTVSLQDAT